MDPYSFKPRSSSAESADPVKHRNYSVESVDPVNRTPAGSTSSTPRHAVSSEDSNGGSRSEDNPFNEFVRLACGASMGMTTSLLVTTIVRPVLWQQRQRLRLRLGPARA